MLKNNICKNSCGFTLIELLIVIAIIGILAAIAIPNFIKYRNNAFCTEAESDAHTVGMAISDYYGVGRRVGLPDVSDLEIDFQNTFELIGHPDNVIEIKMTDRTGRCPESYQLNNPDWDANVFTKFIK